MPSLNHPNSLIKLNVGGEFFYTYYSTLYGSRYFRQLLNNMRRVREMTIYKNIIFLDRSKDTFRYIIQFLRNGHLNVDRKDGDFFQDLIEEADFYGIKDLRIYAQCKLEEIEEEEEDEDEGY
ncbi:POZ domain-containing protein [Rhizopus microsporus var. microsporus]|uniref:POZ domain-containing protein n=2 Tax=Rhizopus microsporus TaxID=58291 RepID=A0A2G4T4U9_RHIZD|nr:POZ domain-containing protein [Rhizopus microsporus ATCC 52813]ORE06685.1 POZ domain-containing protein [Rhizopus microsporus var. microsporus]PHZ15696.1 POZ domain-containing protein [Rhizopus microsporus ATCC 52813]